VGISSICGRINKIPHRLKKSTDEKSFKENICGTYSIRGGNKKIPHRLKKSTVEKP